MPTPIVIGDRATEMLHLGVAAGLGAALAAGATAARRRRRPPPATVPVDTSPVGAQNLIDLTDIVQFGPHDGPRGSNPERSLPVDAHEHRASRA
jgi:hypothetical protein